MLRFSMTERGAEARRAPLAPRLLLGISLGGLHAHMAARPHAHGVNGYAHWDMITGEKEAAGDGLSVCEQLELEGSSHVGRATVFVIWNLGTLVATLIGALEDYVASRGLDRARTFFWISNFMLGAAAAARARPRDPRLRTPRSSDRPPTFLLDPWGPMPSGGCGACGSFASHHTRASSCSAHRRSRSSWCSPPPRRAAPRSPLWSSSTCSSPRLAGATRCASGASSPRSIRSAAPQASTETSPAPCASRSRG